jgi:hypothetical protein
MSAINTGRVIGGGLLAGLVMNVVDVASNFTVLKDDMSQMVDQLHLDPAIMTDWTAMIPWVVVDFIIGILIVLNYASMRPRFGPGPKTALLAGFILYGAVTSVLYGFMSMGVFTHRNFVMNAACAAVSVTIGSLVGGWAYKEN